MSQLEPSSLVPWGARVRSRSGRGLDRSIESQWESGSYPPNQRSGELLYPNFSFRGGIPLDGGSPPRWPGYPQYPFEKRPRRPAKRRETLKNAPTYLINIQARVVIDSEQARYARSDAPSLIQKTPVKLGNSELSRQMPRQPAARRSHSAH